MASTDQPKKPSSGYWLYLEAHRAAIVKQLGTGKGSEVSKKAGEQWKAALPEVKQPFEDRAAKLKAEYIIALKTFKDGGGVVERKSKKSKDNGEGSDEGGKKKKKDKKEKDENAPKKPVGGAYGCYLAANRAALKKELPADHKITDVAKAAGAKWKALSAADRKQYEDQYAANKKKYDEDMKEYRLNRPITGTDTQAVEPKATKRAAEDPNKADKKEVKKAKKEEQEGGQAGGRSKKEVKKPKLAKGGAGPVAVDIAEDVLQKAKKLKLEGALTNLANRPEIVALKLPATKILAALEKKNGLVNAAKRALLEG